MQFLFIIVSAVFYWRFKTERFNQLTNIIAGIGSIMALLVCTYHGYLLTLIGRDAWTGVLPVLFLMISILSGFAFMVLLNILFNKNKNGDGPGINLPFILVLLIILTAFGVFSWIQSLFIGNAEKISIYKLITGKYALITFGGIFFAGLIIPAILFFSDAKVMQNSVRRISTITGCVLVICGSFLIRHLVLMLGQTLN